MTEHCEVCHNSEWYDECSGFSAEDFAPDWSVYPYNEIGRCYRALVAGALFSTRDLLVSDLLGALGDAFPELRCQHLDTDAAGNCRAGCGYNSDVEYSGSYL